MLDDYKFLAASFEERKIDPPVMAIVAFSWEEKLLLKERLIEWCFDLPKIIDTPDELFSFLKQSDAKVILILNGALENQEFFRAIRVSGKKSEVITFSFIKENLDFLRSTLKNYLEKGDLAEVDFSHSLVMRDLWAEIRRLASQKGPVLFQGPPGSGKRSVVNIFHRFSSASGDLEEINGSSEVLKSFDSSHKNFFIKNVENINPFLRKLIFKNNSNKRFLFSSSLDFKELIKREPEMANLPGLNIIKIPSLLERKEEIPFLVQIFLKKFASLHNCAVPKIDSHALKLLIDYDWPNNISELKNMVEKMVVLHGDARITPSKLPVKILSLNAVPHIPLPTQGIVLKEIIQEIETSLIDQALSRSFGNKNQAAKLLGLNRTTLVEKLKKRTSKI